MVESSNHILKQNSKTFHIASLFLPKNIKKKPLIIALYYPSNFELNALKALEFKYFSDHSRISSVIDLI